METSQAYPLDYEAYTTEEIIFLTEFLALMEDYHERPSNDRKQRLQNAYPEVRRIIQNVAEEKRLNKAFYDQTGISIYKTMKSL